MKRLRAGLAALALLTLIASISGCGGSGDDETEATPAKADPAIVAKADANCRQLRREAVKLARNAFSGAPDPGVVTTRLVRPSLAVLESFARRQQRLARSSQNSEFQLYARLFEPIIVLAHQRVQAGLQYAAGVTEASTVARGYEDLMSTVAEEQREAARRAGLEACSIDFIRVLTHSLSS
jgi:hypothetical protein